jgi:hypothetical protein
VSVPSLVMQLFRLKASDACAKLAAQRVWRLHLVEGPMADGLKLWKLDGGRWHNTSGEDTLQATTRGDTTTAVADVATAVADTSVADQPFIQSDASVVGDTASDTDAVGFEAGDSAVAAARRQQRRAPLEPLHGVAAPHVHRPSKHNKEKEVGNFGLFFGNWGLRGTLGGPAAQTKRILAQDRQILKSPAQVVILAEASEELGNLLKMPEVVGSPEQIGVQSRSTKEHFVVRGAETAALLVAARKDNTTALALLKYEAHSDHDYTEKGKVKTARSRMIVCKVSFKQNIGHLGTDIVVCGAHGHYRTMKMEWIGAWTSFWNRLAANVREFGIQFLAGDFNMSFTEVPKQLRSRGILCDCVAWYPWLHVKEGSDSKLGFDSCGIFYIGGGVEVSTPWSLKHIDDLTAVAGNDGSTSLDKYEGSNVPGQPWTSYRSKKLNEKDEDKHLADRLRDLLTPSTTPAELAELPPRAGVWYCAYLRLKSKTMERNEWLVDGTMHNGAHFPLCVFTNNARARSQQAETRRAAKPNKGKGKNKSKDTAVADPLKGKPGGKKGDDGGKGNEPAHAASGFVCSWGAAWSDNQSWDWGGWR